VLEHVVRDLPETVFFLVQPHDAYDPLKTWGDCDALQVRALDDLVFVANTADRTIYGFSEEPPSDGNGVLLALPLQVALERAFFHVAGPCNVVLNAPHISLDKAPRAQKAIEYSLPNDFPAQIDISVGAIPEILGALVCKKGSISSAIEVADEALRRGSFFEAYAIAKEARKQGVEVNSAWFYELYSYSFFGEPQRALEMYERYPERGSADSLAQLLAARYRLLLRQYNECRTILHTISFNQAIGALALTELARSYVFEKEYERAVEQAGKALAKDRSVSEAYLIRGIGQRGLSYDAGESEGLSEANRDFERVARQGGYSASEALYHAGTVCARLGLLDEAERAFRHSLFQRNKISPRDALIRVLVAAGHEAEAVEELAILSQLDAVHGDRLQQDLALCIAEEPSSTASKSERMQEVGESDVAEAREEIIGWKIPIGGNLADFVLLDEFLNCFAPDGDFPKTGEFSSLSSVSHEHFARMITLHLGALMVENDFGAWHVGDGDVLSFQTHKAGVLMPLEHFVYERILLGSSGDNFTSLESLIVESGGTGPVMSPGERSWWKVALPDEVEVYSEEIAWVKTHLQKLGIVLEGNLLDCERLDTWIDTHIEPGGALSDEVSAVIEGDVPRLVSGLGLLLGGIVASMTSATWFQHEKPEGISLQHKDLGRIFPVARAQRRFYLASAADFGLRFSSLAWAIGVASLTDDVRAGALQGQDAVRKALVERIPGAQDFPERELSGVVESVLIGATL
jgi:tetratricopeptide (TPR) repeat protein